MVTNMVSHLASRGYDVNQYHTTWLTEDSATMPLYDFAGKLKGYQTYKPDAPKVHQRVNPHDAKYFTRMMGHGQCVWGLDRDLVKHPENITVVFLTESIFKATALHRVGFNAWSVLGSDVSKQLRQQLLLLPYRFVCAGDDDKAGLKFSRTFNHGFVSHDLDELSPEEVYRLANPFVQL